MNHSNSMSRKKPGRSAEDQSNSRPAKHHLMGDRQAHGKSLRKRTPRSSQAELNLPSNRRDPIEILIESSAHRVKHLVPIRYGRMLQSPFAFYRGAAAIMAADLSAHADHRIESPSCAAIAT